MAKQSVDLGSDILDSRDIEARIDELESDLQDIHDKAVEDMREVDLSALSPEALIDIVVPEDFEEWLKVMADGGDDDAAELLEWREMRDECGSREWRHGLTLIEDSYFERYAQELAEDIGAMENCDRWPATCIDWAQAARELQQDYSQVEVGGYTYWYQD